MRWEITVAVNGSASPGFAASKGATASLEITSLEPETAQ